ncbi:inter-alpha-trypsin inhibitor heavy chain H4 isoform X3 [Plutella xylostella]|uniref:inter-alpha-trypsin inhibitor heavy chain H4 isoform X3 n=1 Tax=Plutella xylostella TaxID=51655 RepID=UPI002032260F|nr:inter-alpha-trypsin inhibitor heavy chain H4 isoform X3 [Plutella xylostella]
MGPSWLLALVLALALASARGAAVPTQDTLVVARSDDESTPAPTSSTTEQAPTTLEPPAPLQLKEMDVKSEVYLRYAHTAVVTRVKNPAARSQEATFRVLLPETAFISGFVMTLNGKPYKAYVKEKEEAKKIYNEAVSQGIGAAHVATKARDSNHFTVSVNVEPNTEALFNLTYEELLSRRNGVYNHAINLHPGVVVDKLTVVVHVREGQKITQLRVPEIRTGNEVDANEDDAQNPRAEIVRSADEKEATVTFKPDREEQTRLMEIYAEKSCESAAQRRRPWYREGEGEGEGGGARGEGALGQFVLQYDVERPLNGEILVNDGYFVHFFAPPSLPPLAKHVVFVLDTSGSMMERKLEQLRAAMTAILRDLHPHDYFSIVEFSSYVQVHDLKEALEEPPPRRYYLDESSKPLTLVPPAPATKDNVEKAVTIVSRLQADGGTNIDQALSVAIELVRKGVNWTPSPATTAEVKPTPVAQADPTPAPAGEEGTTEAGREGKAEAEDLDKPEPIIIFLTDGEPTVGETDPKRIISRLSERNYGPNKATIFSLAFGEDADRGFLRKLSLLHAGFMRHIYEAADAALQLRGLYQQVSSPLLAHVTFTYPPRQVKADSVTRRQFRTYYAGGEAVVAGRVDDEATELAPEVSGFCGVDDGPGKKKYAIFPKIPIPRKKSDYLPLERIWAYLTIKQLLDERDVAEYKQGKGGEKGDGPEKKALDIALKYEFVTPLTSLVVVKPNATNAVDAESVDKESAPPSYNFAPLAASYAGPQFHMSPAYSYSAPHQLSGGGRRSRTRSRAKSYKQLSLNGLDQQDGKYSLVSEEGAFLPAAVVGGAPGLAGPSYPASDAFEAALLPEEAVEEDLDYASLPSTPRAPPSPLQQFHLQEFPWAAPLVSGQSLVLDHNGTTTTLKLTAEDVNALRPDNTFKNESCASAVGSGQPGLCVYLTRCAAARTITADQYKMTYCTVKFSLAGVCCPVASIVSDKPEAP